MKKRRLRCDHDNNKLLFQNDDLHFYQIHDKRQKKNMICYAIKYF